MPKNHTENLHLILDQPIFVLSKAIKRNINIERFNI